MTTKLTILLLVTIIFAAPLGVLSTANDTDCKGCFGDVCYNLTPLSYSEQSCRDDNGNAYYYMPCHSLSSCARKDHDLTPAICQRDSVMPPNIHDCGSTKRFTWSQRGAGVNTGFNLLFQGGTDGRQVNIEFICDKNAGVGQLSPKVPAEEPQLFYHLQWVSAHACPASFKNQTVQCCNYGNDIGQTLSTCTFSSADCLRKLGDFDLIDSKATTSCNTCKEGPKQHWCCVYEKNSSHDFVSKCIADGSQSKQCESESGATLRGQFPVPNCADCFVTL